ncbi:MAG: DUF1353 domain-containing protein, partial [Phenylobacterium sp.]
MWDDDVETAVRLEETDPDVARALLRIAALDWQEPEADLAPEAAEDFGAFEGTPPRVELLDDGRKARLLSPIAYTRPDATRWPAPADIVVDGASIPRTLWSLIGGPFEGKYRNASIVHDYYCDEKTRTWGDTHRMFFEAIRCSGVSAFKAKLMYYGVYRF